MTRGEVLAAEREGLETQLRERLVVELLDGALSREAVRNIGVGNFIVRNIEVRNVRTARALRNVSLSLGFCG